MTLPDHIARSLYVAFRFLFGDTASLKFLEVSARGVMRSFTALLPALPLYFLITWLQLRQGGFEVFDFVYVAGLFVGYGLVWVAFAFSIFYAYSIVGPKQNFLVFMPLYNWARVYVLLILLPFVALSSFEIITGAVAFFVWWFSVALALSYKFFIIRTTLNVSIFHGILFVLYDAVLLTFIEELLFQLFGAFGGPSSPLG